jgi:hypothetical protein
MKFTKAQLEKSLDFHKSEQKLELRLPKNINSGKPAGSDAILTGTSGFISLIESVIGLSEALNHIQSMAGNPDAAEGCRKIIGQSKEALEKWGVGEED